MGGVPIKPPVIEERERHVWRERNLKEIAALIGLGSVYGVLANLLSVLHDAANLKEVFPLLTSLLWIVIDFGFCWAAWQLWLLKPLGRMAIGGWALSLLLGGCMILAADLPIDDAETPAATLLSTMQHYMAAAMGGLAVALLWMTFSKKTRRVVSADYSDVIERTPQISNRPSILALLVLAILGLIGVLYLVGMVLSVLAAYGV